MISPDYFETIKKRGKDSRVYRDYQMLGLEIAKELDDKDHISLYIKLAKQYDGYCLLRVARDVGQRKNVSNKGAYFMRLVQNLKQCQSVKNSKNTRKK